MSSPGRAVRLELFLASGDDDDDDDDGDVGLTNPMNGK